MEKYNEATYGDRIADVYDSWFGDWLGGDAAVATLIDLAGPGPILELGIGTGRIALPLAAKGFAVHGIDASPAMVAKLRAKPGGAKIPVTIGNFAEIRAEGSFSLIFIACNTLFALLTQQEQLRCFENAAMHLTPEGVFVVEVFVPDVTRFDRGQRTAVDRMENDGIRMEVAQHDPLHQRVSARHVMIREDGIKLYPIELRYAWPSELDLMARLAGLRLKERWGGWRRQPFTASSGMHVSVYGFA